MPVLIAIFPTRPTCCSSLRIHAMMVRNMEGTVMTCHQNGPNACKPLQILFNLNIIEEEFIIYVYTKIYCGHVKRRISN